eukprot:tig00000157_g9610.t1
MGGSLKSYDRTGDHVHHQLRPDRYKEQLVLDTDVRVVGPREAVLEWDGGPATLVCKGLAAPTVKGITIRNTGPKNAAVLINGGSRAVVEGCDVSNAREGISGVDVCDAGTAPILRGNIVHDCGVMGLCFYASAKGTAEGNDIYRNAGPGVGIMDDANVSVRGNRIHDQESGIQLYRGGKAAMEGNVLERLGPGRRPER